MAVKTNLTYDSRDRKTKIHAIRWTPENGQPFAILQIVHGMQEYIDRYDEFATFMADHGVLVTGNDHLGHGESISEEVPFGYFCKNDPATVLVRDVHRLKKMTQEEFPGVPIILMGHSFGSFVVREYLTRYGTGVSAAIIQGTGLQSTGALRAGTFLCKLIRLFCGSKHRSMLINGMCFGSYCKKIASPRTRADWLSHNEESIDAYLNNPKDNFVFTLNGFQTMFELIDRTQTMDRMEDIPKNLPILLTAGVQDPVGNYGESVRKLFNIYTNELKLDHVEIKLYDGMRHELQQETGRQEVFDDQLAWIRSVTDRK